MLRERAIRFQNRLKKTDANDTSMEETDAETWSGTGQAAANDVSLAITPDQGNKGGPTSRAKLQVKKQMADTGDVNDKMPISSKEKKICPLM
ncbi:hypothetical protein R1flu_027499 [Riccia fluitans]|uniref:Uncharacterized protein n=1 Tax=Riccia fluitans TaxID=41844 RepID=A0ABD1XLW3_9MARC